MDTFDDLIVDLPDLSELLGDELLDLPKPTPDEERLTAEILKYGQSRLEANARLRAAKRKKEDRASGPSEKISIRIPRWLLSLLREQAALAGMPYQPFIKTILHDVALR